MSSTGRRRRLYTREVVSTAYALSPTREAVVAALVSVGARSSRCPRCEGTGIHRDVLACDWCRPWFDGRDRGSGIVTIKLVENHANAERAKALTAMLTKAQQA